jgi:hypothetical protein
VKNGDVTYYIVAKPRTPKNQEPGQEPQQNPGGRPAGPTSGHQDIADWVAASFTSTSVGNATVYDLQKPK